MPLQYFSSLTFNKSIDNLKKKKKYNYSNVLIDSTKEIKDITLLDDYLKKSDVISKMEDGHKKILVKTRIPNSAMKVGKSAGFRIISIIDYDRNHINFLEVYPKKGKLGKSDLSNGEYKSLLEEYINQLKDSSLDERDPTNNLEIIPSS